MSEFHKITGLDYLFFFSYLDKFMWLNTCFIVLHLLLHVGVGVGNEDAGLAGAPQNAAIVTHVLAAGGELGLAAAGPPHILASRAGEYVELISVELFHPPSLGRVRTAVARQFWC